MFYSARRLVSGLGFGVRMTETCAKSERSSRGWRSACFHGMDSLEQRVLLSGEHLVYTVQPQNTTAGVTFSVVVTEEDGLGNVVNASGDQVILSAPSAGVAPFFSAVMSNGVATFNNVVLLEAGDHVLSAQDFDTPSVTEVDSNSFNVAPAAPAALVFKGQPVTLAGALAPVQVKVVDIYGNVVTSDSSNITISIATGPAGAALTGTTTLAATNGVANFTTLGLATMGNYTLQAVDIGLTSVTSNNVEIRPQVTLGGTFNSSTGKVPSGEIVMDSAGNIFGTTSSGGANGNGTVYEVFKDSGTVGIVASFNVTNGAAPMGGLVQDKNGNLFGTTSAGGANGDGTIFEIVKGSGTITTLMSFNGTNGSAPLGGLAIDKLGNLYGTTSTGGANGKGEVFEWTVKKGQGQLVIWTSFNGQNGTNPEGDLTLDKSGNVYGTTFGVNNTANGTVFKVAKSGKHVVTVLKTFSSSASAPIGGVVVDKLGNVFGTTGGFGRSDDGTIFEITKTGVFSTLASFGGTDGNSPQAGLLLDSSGDIFGTTNDGGEFGFGEIFELSKGSGTIHVLTSLDGGSDGAFPQSTLVSDGHGKMIGIASEGGSGDWGTAFSFAMPAPVTPPVKLVFVKGTNGTEVNVEDAHGKVITGGTFDVTLKLVSAPTGVVIGSLPATVTTVNGVATFSNVTLPNTPGKYVLSTTDWGVKAATLTIQVKA